MLYSVDLDAFLGVNAQLKRGVGDDVVFPTPFENRLHCVLGRAVPASLRHPRLSKALSTYWFIDDDCLDVLEHQPSWQAKCRTLARALVAYEQKLQNLVCTAGNTATLSKGLYHCSLHICH
jgi:hypothetical protein